MRELPCLSKESIRIALSSLLVELFKRVVNVIRVCYVFEIVHDDLRQCSRCVCQDTVDIDFQLFFTKL